MTNLTTYPLQDWFETSLAQSWNGATGTVFLNTAPSFTFPSGVKTYIVVNPWKTNMQVGRIDSMNVGNKTVNVDSITIEKWAGVNYTAQIHAVGSKVIISDNYQFWKDIATAINSKAGTDSPVFTGSVTVPEYADDTARDAAIPSPTDGMIVQTGWVYQGYNSGTAQWEDFDIGTPAPNASTTVKWLVQIATDAEVGASTTTGSTWAKLAINPWSVVKASSGAGDENKLPVLNASWQLDAWFIDNDAVLAAWVEALVDKDTYLLWEPAAAGDSLFVEDTVTYAAADQAQWIWDTAGNTRVAFRQISSWTYDDFSIWVDDVGTPSTDLIVELYLASGWLPTGSALWTATIPNASITGTKQDLAVVWDSVFTRPDEWTEILFVFRQTSDTVNGSNYFRVYYDANNTTTRYWLFYDGADWVDNGTARSSEVNQAGVASLWSSSSWNTLSRWNRFAATNNIRITKINKHASCTATRAVIRDTWWTILDTASFIWNVATLSSSLEIWSWVWFRVEVDSNWWTYVDRYWVSSFPIYNAYITWITSSLNWWDQSSAFSHNITSIDLEPQLVTGDDFFPYLSSDWVEDKLLSRTDATYSYKLPTDVPRIATESKGTGENVIATTLWFNDNFSGLTPLAKYYISDTPWVVSSTVWTNMYPLWQAIDSTTLNVVRKYGVGTISTLNTTVAAPNTTVTSTSYLATFDAEFGFIFDLNVSWASSSATGTIQYSTDNSTRYTMQTESIGAGASRSYRVIPVIAGRYYRTSVNQNANRTGGTTTITLDMARPL